MFQISESKDFFLKDGQPFFYLADTVWAAFANLSIEEWRSYLRYRKMQGFNALQISILPITDDTSVSEKSIAPFLPDEHGDWDFYQLNPAYFDKAEKMVAMAVESGFAPLLGVLWRCYVPGTAASARGFVPSAMPLDAMKAYANHVTKRFQAYSPLYFISGDTAWDSEQEPRYYMTALDITRQNNPNTLLTMHLCPHAFLPDEFVDKVDFYMYQSGHGAEQRGPYELAEKHGSYRIKRPLINGEPCYEGHGRGGTIVRFSAFDVRKAVWQSLLSGSKMGVAYGAHGVWSCHFEGMTFTRPNWQFMPYDWDLGLHLPGAWDVAFAKWLFEQFDLYDIHPAALLDPADNEVAVAVNRDRSKIALYLPYAYDISLSIDLSSYVCEAFDLDSRRPFMPEVSPSRSSRVRLSMCNSDVLFLAQRTSSDTRIEKD